MPPPPAPNPANNTGCTYHCYAPPSQVGGGLGLCQQHISLWEGHLTYVGSFYCTFACSCSSDLMKEIALVEGN